MEDTIRIKTVFSREIKDNGPHNQSLMNPFIVITTPFMPTLISISVTFIISGLKTNGSYFVSVEFNRCDSNDIIFKSKKFLIDNANKSNTIVNFALNNAEIKQTESGDYKATITIFDQDKKELKTDGDTFKLVKTEE